MATDWTLRFPGHSPLFSDDKDFDDDYLWTCECGSTGEDIETRDAHILTVVGLGVADAPPMATLHVVEVVLSEGGDPMEATFLFEDQAEARKFDDHMRDLYEKNTTYYIDNTLDYQSAIDRAVEMIGPSED